MAHIFDQTEQTQGFESALRSRQFTLTKDAGLVVGASLLMAASAHIAVPLIFSPVPITMQPFAMLLIAFFLGANRASAAMVLYLMEGIAGMPVFSPTGPGGIVQLMGPTGGFLLANPLSAYVAGKISRSEKKTTAPAKTYLLAAIAAEAVLFTGGLAWFAVSTDSTLIRSVQLAMLPFLPGEVLKVAAAVGIFTLWSRSRFHNSH